MIINRGVVTFCLEFSQRGHEAFITSNLGVENKYLQQKGKKQEEMQGIQ